MTDDLREAFDSDSVPLKNIAIRKAFDRIKDLEFQIKVIQGAAQHAQKAYEQHLAVYRKALDEKPPVWHDDIQSLQARDAIMTERIEKLEAALREIVNKDSFSMDWAIRTARKALEGKDD